MAHFAKLDDNNVVLEVHCVANETLDPNDEENSGIQFLIEWSNGHSRWVQTSYNDKFRKQYAGIGFTYDSVNDVFIAPQPFASWSLDQNFDWQAPKAKPENIVCYWSEEEGDWVAVS